MTPLRAAKTFITARLSEGAAAEAAPGGAHASVVPQGEGRTAYVFDHLGGTNVAHGSGNVGAHPLEFLVRAVASGTAFPEDAADALYEALHGARGTVGTYQIIAHEQAPFEEAASEPGKEQRQRGGRYLVLVRPL